MYALFLLLHSFKNTIYNEPLKVLNGSLLVSQCTFKNIKGKSNGGALFFSNELEEAKLEMSIFSNCYSPEKGGGAYITGSKITSTKNCFEYCLIGNGDGNDASAIYMACKNSTNDIMNSYSCCPQHSKVCWYGICNIWNGYVVSYDINISNSHTRFVTGLIHGGTAKSDIRRYVSFNITEGNSLSFANGAGGVAKDGLILNCNTGSGFIYVQAAAHNITNFLFKDSKGLLTHMCICGSVIFDSCTFDRKEGEMCGPGYGSAVNCKFETTVDKVTPFENAPEPLTCIGYQDISKIKKEKKYNFNILPFIVILISFVLLGALSAYKYFVYHRMFRRTLSISCPYILQTSDLETEYKSLLNHK